MAPDPLTEPPSPGAGPAPPPLSRSRAFSARLPWFIIAVTLGAALLALYLFNPETAALFPACQFHALTGWDCPGCGGLRAVHQLLHGNIAAAFRLNPLLFLLGFLALGWLGWAWIQRRRNPPGNTELPRQAIFVLIAVILLYGILRNVVRLP